MLCFLNLLNSFISHTSYVLSAQKNHLSEMVLFSIHNTCCGLEKKQFYFMQPYLEVWLMLTKFTLGLYKPHIICLGAHKSCFSEMVLLSIHSMCCDLVERKGILHQALLSVCLVDVYSI